MMSNNSFSDYDDDYNVHGKAINCNNDDGNGNDDDTLYDTIEVNIPEDELNYRASNLNKILQMVLSIFLQLGCKWTLKWCQVDNDGKTAFDEQSEGLMKRKNGECHMKVKFHTPDLLDYLDGMCPNPDPLKRTHSPQGMLSLIDQTGCSVMKRKDGECPDPEVKLYYQRAYKQYYGQPVGEMDYVWGDNESMSNSSTVPEVKLHKRHNIIPFHYVISMISQGYINLKHLASK